MRQRVSLLAPALWGAAALLVPAAALAQPSLIPIQGYLADDLGSPVDGVVPGSFTVFDAATGGTALFTHTLDCDPAPDECLVIDDGHFLVTLGSLSALDLSMFEDNEQLWLAVEVDGEVLMPRTRLMTVPYAAYAGRASAIDWDDIENVPSVVTDPAPTYSAASPLLLDAGTQTFSLSTAGCDAGDGWLWNGSAWTCAPAQGEDYVAGDGVAIDAVTRTIQTAAAACTPGEYSRWTGSAWVCSPDVGGIATLEAGNGIGVLGNRIDIAAPTCGADEYLRWNGTAFVCVADVSDEVTAGDGLTTTGGALVIDSPACAGGQVSRWTGTGWQCVADQVGITALTAGDGIGVVGATISVAAPTCGAGQYLGWSGSAFTCVDDASDAVDAGLGIDLTGTTLSIDSPICGAGEVSRFTATGWQCVTDQSGLATVTAGNGIGVSGSTISIASPTCGAGEYSRFDGTNWTCVTDARSHFTGGDGIDVSAGGEISTSAATCAEGFYSAWNGSAWICRAAPSGTLTNVTGAGPIGVSTPSAGTRAVALSSTGCAAGSVWRWNGSAWACTPPVTAGNGISVTGASQVSINATACPSGSFSRWTGSAWACEADQTGLASLTAGNGIGVSGSTIAIAAPTCGAGEYLSWTGSAFTCVADASTSLGAGNGLTLSGSNLTINSPTCSSTQRSRWTGSAWVCADVVSAVTAGSGISIASSGGTRTVSTASPTCAANEYSRWDGSAWTCVADVSTSYTPGTGISISAGNQISTNATVCPSGQFSRWTAGGWTCATPSAGVTVVSATGPITATGTASNRTIGLQSTGCPASSAWMWTGVGWNCQATVVGGNGISVVGNEARIDASPCPSGSFSRWTGSTWACEAPSLSGAISTITSTAPVVVTGNGASRNIALSTAGCVANEAWVWNGTSWVCDVPVLTGNGLSRSGRTVSTNSPTCSTSQVSRWTGSSWTCVNNTSLGNIAPSRACTTPSLPSIPRRIRVDWNMPSWQGENSILLTNSGGSVITTVRAWPGGGSDSSSGGWNSGDLAAGTYRLRVQESWGDGWHGGWARVRYNDAASSAQFLDTGALDGVSGWVGPNCGSFNCAANRYYRDYTFTLTAATAGGGGGAANCSPANTMQRIVHGVVDANGDIVTGSGFGVYRRDTGVYEVQFNGNFSRRPSGTVTQVYPNRDNHGVGGSTLDNAIITGISTNRMTVVTGGSNGSRGNREFSFIVVGQD